jgi:DNA repair photolyase
MILRASNDDPREALVALGQIDRRALALATAIAEGLAARGPREVAEATSLQTELSRWSEALARDPEERMASATTISEATLDLRFVVQPEANPLTSLRLGRVIVRRKLAMHQGKVDAILEIDERSRSLQRSMAAGGANAALVAVLQAEAKELSTDLVQLAAELQQAFVPLYEAHEVWIGEALLRLDGILA